MLRKLFATTMGVALTGAAIVGGVYAWDASAGSGTQVATVGTASISVQYTPSANLLGPNGTSVLVGDGSITNGGSFPVSISSGSVAIDALTSNAPNGPGTCVLGDFAGSVTVTDASAVAPTASGGGFDVNVLTGAGAAADCQGDTVDYTVTINATT
ncbi:MAG: hypothetical protein O3A10_00680 [Chloroflexi bacterium]|nr:hypothetical protein [Chloroflexota bacterium]MDA1146296.1 hypothetical protein [Chloroflexota bacterium]